MIAELFDGAGFEVIPITCQVGKVPPEERGVEGLEDLLGVHCNPIVQAGILNKEETELNFMIGMCIGHDILFTRYSEAPVSTLIVKDKFTAHNPAATLYISIHYRHMWNHYCGDKK